VAAGRHQCVAETLDGTHCDCDPGLEPTGAEPNPCVVNAQAEGASCADAIAIEPGMDVPAAHVAAATTDLTTSTCDYRHGVELYYGLYLPVRSRVRLFTDVRGSLSIRRTCERTTQELACKAQGTGANGMDAAVVARVLDAGRYFFVVDGVTPGTTVHSVSSIEPDPCALMAACPTGQELERSPDWSSCSCVCPFGTTADGEACVPDPCVPNPCVADAATRCITDSTVGYHCECPSGYGPAPSALGVCEPAPSAALWTVIVLANADNDLQIGDPYSWIDGLDASSPIDVVWLHDTPTATAKLLHLGQGETLGHSILADWGEADMGCWRNLRDLGLYAAAHYPAQHVALVIADHGGGWYGMDAVAKTRGFSTDISSDSEISVSNGDYARALAPLEHALGQRLELVDFETCLMATWEVAEATRPYANYLVGSPEISYGANAELPIALLAAEPEQTTSAWAHALTDARGGSSYTAAAADLVLIDQVTADLSALADALRAHPELCPQYELLASNCHNYMSSDIDLSCFAAEIAAASNLPAELAPLAQTLAQSLAAAVYFVPVLNGDAQGGLSIYRPAFCPEPGCGYGLDPQYTAEGAVWSERATWDELLLACTQ
jgi:hypothetical protein